MFHTALTPSVYKTDTLQVLYLWRIYATFVTINATTMNTRLKQFLAAENITQAQFADNINVVRASVSHVLSGRNNPSYEFIRSIMLKYPDLNIEWLMFGKGKMYRNSPVTELSLQAEEQPVLEPDSDELFPEYEDSTTEHVETIETIASDNRPQAIVNQRKVSKIIVLFDDGSYQEM